MKRVLCALFALAVLLSAAGCASVFDREYYVVEEYEAPSESADAEDDAADTISNYAALRRAIVRLVSDHTESAQLQFQNYDGSISQDISTACWEVKSSTALGAFAVDYISYDLSRIVSYYQAEIYITYKRAAWQVEAIEPVSNVRLLTSRLDEALREGETYLVIEINSAAVNGETVGEAVGQAYYADPLACPVLPAAATSVFPESGVSHILEITLDYGMDGETLSERREALSGALETLAASIGEDASGYERVGALCAYLAAACAFSDEAGSTAYDALVLGEADSEGAAMAFEAGCRALGYDCVTVSGRMDGEPHFWNIVTVGGAAYHVDVTVWNRVFLVSDEALLSAGYWWDNSEYPVCGTSFDPASENISDEPEASGEPAAE